MSQMQKTLAKQTPKATPIASVRRRKLAPKVRGTKEGGVVAHCVHGSSSKTAAKGFTPSKLILSLKAGLPVQELDDLQTSLDLPMERLCKTISANMTEILG